MELLEGAAAIQDRGVPGLHAPMVGRDEELSLLLTMFRQIIANNRAGGWRRLKREGATPNP